MIWRPRLGDAIQWQELSFDSIRNDSYRETDEPVANSRRIDRIQGRVVVWFVHPGGLTIC